jgi:hypothetical protein
MAKKSLGGWVGSVHAKNLMARFPVLRALEEIVAKRQHYETVMTQILLANPEYLSSLKKKKGWLSKGKIDTISRFAERITPHKIRERAWLNDMKKKISGLK